MVHSCLQQPAAALWLYVFVVIILLVLSWVGASGASKWDPKGNSRVRGGLGFLIVAIILGIIIYFLIAADIQQWAWFIALLPTAILLFGIYFAFFAVFGQVFFWIGSLIALFVMIWLIYYSFVNQHWGLLAFPIIYLIIIIAGGFGFAAWKKWQRESPALGTEELLAPLEGEKI